MKGCTGRKKSPIPPNEIKNMQVLNESFFALRACVLVINLKEEFAAGIGNFVGCYVNEEEITGYFRHVEIIPDLASWFINRQLKRFSGDFWQTVLTAA